MTARRIYIPDAMPSRDANGRALMARLRFYEPTGTLDTLKAVYTSSALTTQHEQPIETDDQGRFPAIWGDDAQEWDVAYSDRSTDARIKAWEGITTASDALAASVALADAAADAAETAQAAAETAATSAETIATDLGDLQTAVTEAEASAAAAAASAEAAQTWDPTGYVRDTRTITAAGLATGGGDLSANRTVTVTAATASETAALSATDKATTPGGIGSALAFVDGGTGSGTYTPSHAAGPNHKRSMNGNTTLAALSNPKEGEPFYIELRWTATATLSINSGYKFFNGAPVAPTASGSIAAISGIVISASPFEASCSFLYNRQT